jgi:Sap, sulfolipid-1-addressing protein
VAHLIGLVILIGLLDSLNPSTVAPALYLAGGREPQRSLLGFTTGVFAVNLAAGLALALGPGQAILAFAPHPGFEVRRLLELSLGLATGLVAVALWFARKRVSLHVAGTSDRIDGSSLLVGAGITAAELPTAVPYFAVIAAVVGSGQPIGTQVALLVVFNGVFVAPLIGVLILRSLLRARGRETIERMRLWLDRRLPTAIPALVGLVALLLTARGALGLAHHFRHR